MASFTALRTVCIGIGFVLGWALWTHLASALPAARRRIEEQARQRGRPSPALPGDLFAAAGAPLALRVTAYGAYLGMLAAFTAPVPAATAPLSQAVSYATLAALLSTAVTRNRRGGGAALPSWLAVCREVIWGAFMLFVASRLTRMGLARQESSSVAFGALIVGLSLSRVTWVLFVGRERQATRS